MKTVSIVIPCYRSASYLGDVVKEILKKTKGINLKELILVDDGSPDDVWDVIRKLSRENKLIKGIHFSRNFGQHAALMAGYRKAGGDYIGHQPYADREKHSKKKGKGKQEQKQYKRRP